MERLTQSSVAFAEAGNQTRGWYNLCQKGYLPAEIEIFTGSRSATDSDIRIAVRKYALDHNLPVPISCEVKINRRERICAPDDFRAAFRSTVMRTGMTLSLTQPMLEFLCAVSDGVRWDRAEVSTLAKPSNDIATAGSLEKRGLIRRKTQKVLNSPEFSNQMNQLQYNTYSFHELTALGKILVDLLKEAGIFIAADASFRKQK
jgi:hypothetical protein